MTTAVYAAMMMPSSNEENDNIFNVIANSFKNLSEEEQDSLCNKYSQIVFRLKNKNYTSKQEKEELLREYYETDREMYYLMKLDTLNMNLTTKDVSNFWTQMDKLYKRGKMPILRKSTLRKISHSKKLKKT